VNTLTGKYVSMYRVIWKLYQRVYLENVQIEYDTLRSKPGESLIKSPLDLSALIIAMFLP